MPTHTAEGITCDGERRCTSPCIITCDKRAQIGGGGARTVGGGSSGLQCVREVLEDEIVVEVKGTVVGASREARRRERDPIGRASPAPVHSFSRFSQEGKSPP